jgi:hypothetical protein
MRTMRTKGPCGTILVRMVRGLFQCDLYLDIFGKPDADIDAMPPV